MLKYFYYIYIYIYNMNLLLIHSQVRDQQTVINSLTENTRYIIIDYFQDDLQTIKDKISALNLSFDRIGLFQENDNKPFYQLTRKLQRSTLVGVEMQDVNLDTWTDFTDLLMFCKNLNMTNFDIMDCNVAKDKNWLYVISQIESKLNVIINASSNETGNSAMSGDWILEKGNVNLIGTYFTEDIKEYKYTLGGGGGDSFHSLIIKDDGNVYACGYNGYGQLGIGNQYEQPTLIKMTKPEGLSDTVKAIQTSTGNAHSLVLYDNGFVYACGDNYYGQLGIDNGYTLTLIEMIRPIGLPVTAKAINIAAGEYHSLVLYDNGSVYGCGNNYYGQLGVGDGDVGNKPTLTEMTKPDDLSNTTIAINIATGYDHSIVLYDNGYVYACGNNYVGQLGNQANYDGDKESSDLLHMQYYNGGDIINVTDASTEFIFAIIFFNPSQIKKTYNGNTKLTLTPPMYTIYTYNPLQPTITINTYTANFNNKNIGTNKTVTISVNQLKDNTNNTNNTNYVFVIPYTSTGTITSPTQESKYKYINRYTTLQSLSTFKVIRTKKRAYVVISYKIKPNELFVEFIQNI